MSSASKVTRRPYTGSCHCGHIKYIIYLSLPDLPYPKTNANEFIQQSGHRIYKCNCTMCHKPGLFHIRLVDAANDFFVVSPSDPLAEGSGLKRYSPGGEGGWRFCETCGIRAFAVRGTEPLGYNDEVDMPTALLQRLNSRTLDGTPGNITAKDAETTRTNVWRPKKDWQEARDDENDTAPDYISVNALTLDAHNDNLDLRQLQEKGYVGYMQTLQWVGYDYQDTPYFGGTY
jgi:hypothetical protein